MSKRHVWVIEGRRRGREKELWRPQVAFCSYKSEALKRHAAYCEVNLRYEFRVTKYVPEGK